MHVRRAAGLFGLVSHMALPGDKVAVLSTFDVSVVLRPLGDHDELMGALKQSVSSNSMRISMAYLLTVGGQGLWSLSLLDLLKLFSSIIRKIQVYQPAIDTIPVDLYQRFHLVSPGYFSFLHGTNLK